MMHPPHPKPSTPSIKHMTAAVFTLLITLACLPVTTAMAQMPGDLLTLERWEDRAQGISLRPPLGAQVLRLSADDAILRIAHPSGYRITVHIKHSAGDLKLDEVVNSAAEQAYDASMGLGVRKVDDPFPIKLGSLPGMQFTFATTPARSSPTVMSQAYALLSPQKLIIIALNSPPDAYEQAKAVFTQLLASVTFEDPEEMAKQRLQMLADGQAWLATITPEMMHKALVADQWFRIVDKKQDVGYMRITQRTEKALDVPGVRIDVQSRLLADRVAYDTLSNYFASDSRDPERRSEIWSVRTTARPQAGAPKGAQETSWSETGLMAKKNLSLTRVTPQGSKPFNWDMLPEDYIAQAHAMLLPTLLTPADRKTLAFYAYYANTGKISIRTERVEASADGSYRVHSRPSPELQEQVTYFDATGKVLRKTLPGGQTLIPASAEEIANRWKLRQ